MRPDEGRKYPGPEPLSHSSIGRISVRIDAPEPTGLGNPQHRQVRTLDEGWF